MAELLLKVMALRSVSFARGRALKLAEADFEWSADPVLFCDKTPRVVFAGLHLAHCQPPDASGGFHKAQLQAVQLYANHITQQRKSDAGA